MHVSVFWNWIEIVRWNWSVLMKWKEIVVGQMVIVGIVFVMEVEIVIAVVCNVKV